MVGKIQCADGEVEICVTQETVEWKLLKPHRSKRRQENIGKIKMENVVAVGKDENSFSVHWAIMKAKNLLRVEKTKFTCEHEEQCDQWMKRINDSIDIASAGNRRPKRVLVIVNPLAGRRKAEKLYEEVTSPLFRLAGISAHRILTEKKGHAVQLLHEYDLATVDCVVSVGGDGTFRECFTGLLLRAMKDEGYDPPQADVPLKRLDVKLGTLPAGTGNVLPFALNGADDLVTATLNIILGHCGRTLDIGTHYCGERFLGFSAIGGAIGFSSDFMYDTERSRQRTQFMGKLRIIPIIFKNMFNRRPVELTIEYTANSTEMRVPEKDGTQAIVSEDSAGAVKKNVITGTFVDFFYTHVTYHDSEYAMMLSPGRWHLYLINRCSVLKHLKIYKKLFHSTVDFDQSGMEELSYHEAEEVRIRITGGGTLRENDQYILNLDGEILYLPEPKVTSKLNKGILSCYGIKPE